MEKTKQMVEETPKGNENTDEKVEAKQYEYGDLILQCFSCGNIDVLQRGIKGGISIPPLATTEDHHLTFACPKCNAKLSLKFLEGAAPIEKEEENEETESKESAVANAAAAESL